MTDEQLPAPIAEFVRATNAGDSDAFVAAFTDDAELIDWGRTFHGRDGVRSWDRTDNIGVHSRFEVVGWRWEAADTVIVDLTVTGDGYNGTGPMTFELRDGLIGSLVIAPTD
ncbi:nuclear transport factor 2 family protein [Leifsonia sp. ZF2019]|uniref:nuclear transport factor 2 family protein n=1 Tax=Leifsonia sp. ZF2019 TaxID=2781978 RepID=UPI001CC09D53|nr:nuclear transport factor 2 family protein [Leifsonia sp. ZF2019]UAJ80730.1 nuclear transport factor 2 family protein [Leifsonia sp. ZF2019]